MRCICMCSFCSAVVYNERGNLLGFEYRAAWLVYLVGEPQLWCQQAMTSSFQSLVRSLPISDLHQCDFLSESLSYTRMQWLFLPQQRVSRRAQFFPEAFFSFKVLSSGCAIILVCLSVSTMERGLYCSSTSLSESCTA